jgi:adenosylcobinamide-phosphate synthase
MTLVLSDPAARFLLLAAALLLDALVGDPRWLWRLLPHPVVLVGKLVGWLDRRLNRISRSSASRRLRGGFTVLLVVGLAAAAGWALGRWAEETPWGWTAELLLVAVLIAQRDLFDHVRRVRRGLVTGGIAGGRAAVSMIVGRDPDSLDEHGVARAAIESLAENFSDGVVAPVCWYLAFGPAGLCAYKAINTLDSMIGHRSERYRDFGMVAARLDDVANLIPARLSGLLLAAAALLLPTARPIASLKVMFGDAGKHRSPNAGWPEAAMAGALDLALLGPRRYGPELVNDPWIGSGRARATVQDMRRALGLFAGACFLLLVLVLACFWLLLVH